MDQVHLWFVYSFREHLSSTSQTMLSAVRKVAMTESTTLTVVDGVMTMAKEAAGHGGCKGSGDGGDKAVQLQ